MYTLIKSHALFGILLIGCGVIAGVLPAEVASPQPKKAPALPQSLNIEQDQSGKILQDSFIWRNAAQEPQGVALGFRKSSDLSAKPSSATLRLFADARYILWVNGAYVDRGPARFQPNGPEYDSIEIAPFLHPGKNAVALLVYGNLSDGGKVMRHRPGVTASLDIDGKTLWNTDESWCWSDKTRFRSVGASWANLGEKEVDARVEDGDWTTASYDDSAWKPCLRIPGDSWGPLTARRIPRLRETPVPFHFSGEVSLPVTLKDGQRLEFTTDRLVQAYPVIEFEATEGTELTIQPFNFHYIAKAGKQTHFTVDTCGIDKGAVVVKSGQATVTGFKLIERLYPYDRLGAFHGNDPFLNKLWEMCARSCEVLSEDSYVDCADRERVEWMDDTPPGYDITRTVMSSQGNDGKARYGDPRLLGELIRRTALTLQPEGWVKAHTCSDRFDIHAKMEDRACDWVEGVRLYHEATGDTQALREIWPAIKAQMEYFLSKRTPKGLVSLRDWVVWHNPTGYQIGQATPVNCFVCRALADASVIAGIVGDAQAAERYATASRDLKQAINRELWDERSGSYFGGFFTPEEIAASNAGEPLEKRLTNGFFPPTLEANIFALDRGVVPEERKKQVQDAILAEVQGKQYVGGGVMTAYYLFKELYALDRPDLDTLMLTFMRKNYRNMVNSPLECSWEEYGSGSHAHIYGMYPGYLLSGYVLGVRRDDPVAGRKLLIEPHLGDLTEAEGTVVTEFGPVKVSWKRSVQELSGEVTVPEGVTTTLALPVRQGKNSLVLDGRPVTGDVSRNRLLVKLPGGKHTVFY